MPDRARMGRERLAWGQSLRADGQEYTRALLTHLGFPGFLPGPQRLWKELQGGSPGWVLRPSLQGSPSLTDCEFSEGRTRPPPPPRPPTSSSVPEHGHPGCC